jgi:hypothetical protein
VTAPSDAAPRPESAPATGSPPVTEKEDELPDWEPLTPELVEEEAVRGDAVLRNAVLLLAVLLSWTQISDTAVLVRIKTGQFMARHGLLPPATDPFSVSAEGRPWINVAWLCDLALAGTHHVGRVISESCFTDGKILTLWGVAAGLATFWTLSRISLPGLPTWWGSIVGALALVAAFPSLTAGPPSVTLLGTAILLWVLHRASTRASTPSMPSAAALFLVWSNLDPLAWFGLGLLWAAALAGAIPPGSRPGVSNLPPGSLLKVAVVATVASLINPFHWHVLESPFVLFGSEIPEAREYGGFTSHFRWMLASLTDERFYWGNSDIPAVVAPVLAVVTLLTLLVNWGRVPLGHVAMFLVANGLALKAGLFWPVASLVNAAIAGVNGQSWYSRTFRQTYSVAVSELIFSRGGRAVTVLGLFGIAYLMINGALPGASGRRLGMGFDWRIETATQSYMALALKTEDPRSFNGRPDHGDLMIWAGLRPFNDSRLALYARGEENLLRLHRDTFRALQVAQTDREGTGKPEVWKATFDRFHLQHVYARLTGDDGPAKYSLLRLLMLNPELTLAAVDGAATRLDRVSAGAAAPRVSIDFQQAAFRAADSALAEVPAWPRELTTYERWLIQPEPSIPLEGQIAQHYAFLADELGSTPGAAAARPGETAHALRVLALRLGRQSLSARPNTAQVFRVFANVYPRLLAGEQGFGQANSLFELRRQQIIAAEYFSLLTTVAKPEDHEQLALTLATLGYRDVALEQLEKVQAKTGRWTAINPQSRTYDAVQARNQSLVKELRELVEEVKKNGNREIQRGEDPIQVAKSAFDAGCPQYALSILEPLQTQIIRDPMAAIFHAQVLHSCGRVEEAWERLEGTEALFPPDELSAPGSAEMKSIWRSNTAMANVVRGDFDRAINLWKEEAEFIARSSVRGALESFPLSAGVAAQKDLTGYVGVRIGSDVLYTFPERWAAVQMLICVASLEQGKLSQAREAVQLALDRAPQASLRPLAAYYHTVLTGETVSLAPFPAPATEDQMFLDDGSPFDPNAAAGASDSDRPPAPPMAAPLDEPR